MATDTNPRAAGLVAAVFFLAPLLTAIAPRLTLLFFALVAIVLIVAAFRRGLSWKELLIPSGALAACLAFSLYTFVNASWAWNPGAGLEKASVLLLLVLLAFAVSTAVKVLDERPTRGMSRAFIAGASLGALFLLIEVATGGALTRFVYNTLPIFRPDNAKRLVIADGEVRSLNLAKLNQNVTIIMLAMWATIFMLSTLATQYRKWLWIALFFLVSATTILLSSHDSSQLALFGSVAVFGLAFRWGRLVIRGLAVIWCLAFVVVLPASFLAHNANLHLDPSMPYSYKARIILWQFTAEKTLEHPWLGVGVNSTRELDNAGVNKTKGPQEKPEGFVFARTTGHHGHSLFLQTWHELGAVGAVLLAVAGALVILRAETLPRNAQAFAAASFTVFAIVAAFAWGMWQTWWMCGIGLMAVYLCLACQLSASQPPPAAGASS